ncbi:NUDIX domain-containing protein [Longispora sp. K20-0274]|uniref:NUDIX hydrolase n=1 Tax=Longispora sp. K20-0274 TaxID=3088255 RepID=UPI00399B4009
MSERPKHSVSVAAVVVNDEGRVLVIKRRDNGSWEIPGGILELDESIHDGVRREVLEETGVEIAPERLTGVYKNLKAGVVALVFRARVTGGSIRPTDESEDVAWWSDAQVVTGMRDVFSTRVFDALNGRRPTVRIHDGSHFLD